MGEFLKTTNWQTTLCGAVAVLCAIFGVFNEHARSLCEVFAIAVLGVGQIAGVDVKRFQRVVDVVDKYVLLYKQHPIDEVLASTTPADPANPKP